MTKEIKKHGIQSGQSGKTQEKTGNLQEKQTEHNKPGLAKQASQEKHGQSVSKADEGNSLGKKPFEKK